MVEDYTTISCLLRSGETYIKRSDLLKWLYKQMEFTSTTEQKIVIQEIVKQISTMTPL